MSLNPCVVLKGSDLLLMERDVHQYIREKLFQKIFLRNDVEERFKELVQEVCEELQIQIVAFECDKVHSHMFLNALPRLSPSDIMANRPPCPLSKRKCLG